MITGTAETFRVFTRTWWRRNPAWPNGRAPGAGRKTTIARHCSEEEARQICKRYNETHDPGFLSRQAEYERERERMKNDPHDDMGPMGA